MAKAGAGDRRVDLAGVRERHIVAREHEDELDHPGLRALRVV
jgi:hypothetical protein